MKKLMFLASRKFWMSHFLGLIFLIGPFAFVQSALVPRCSAAFDGSATGKVDAFDTDLEEMWFSKLNPVPAVLETGQDPTVNSWVLNALNAAKFNAANGWTINVKALNGYFTLGAYYAWVSEQPTLIAGNLWSTGTHTGRIGGAAFDLEYTPEGTDPTGAAVDWLQIVHSNNQFATNGYSEGNGYYDFVDDFGGTKGPTYIANGGTANAYSFLDTPYDVCPGGYYSSTSQFVTAIATVDLTDKTLTIYRTAVEWGYNFENDPFPTPEPCTLLLLGLGAAMLRRKRS